MISKRQLSVRRRESTYCNPAQVKARPQSTGRLSLKALLQQSLRGLLNAFTHAARPRFSRNACTLRKSVIPMLNRDQFILLTERAAFLQQVAAFVADLMSGFEWSSIVPKFNILCCHSLYVEDQHNFVGLLSAHRFQARHAHDNQNTKAVGKRRASFIFGSMTALCFLVTVDDATSSLFVNTKCRKQKE